MPGFHSHDDDFLYIFQSSPQFEIKDSGKAPVGNTLGGSGLEKLLTSADVCQLLSISPRTLQRLVARKAINYIRLTSGSRRFRPTAVALFVAQREVKSR